MNRPSWWRNLLAAELISAAIDRIQQTLREVCARTKELHLLANAHRRNTTRNRSIISPRVAHDLVAFELNRAGVDGDSGGETTESLGQAWRVPDREVWLRRWTKIVERLQKAKARLRYERAAIVSHAANRFCYPRRITGEELVVFR